MTHSNSPFRVVLVHRPDGAPKASDFAIEPFESREPGDGEVAVKVLYLSLDPALRPRMNAVTDYAEPVPLGGTIPSPAIGVVTRSRSSLLAEGDHVFGFLGWQTDTVIAADQLRKIDPARAPLPKWMSLLGLSSFTAWVGLTELGRPKPGETVVVSAASGATGAAVGQIARIMGARAVGIAGGERKCRFVTDNLGFDACVDYKAPDFLRRLAEATPNGVDVDFENVGGDILQAVFDRMNLHGRVLICGLVAQYSSSTPPPGPNLWPTVQKALRIEGFRASRYFDRIPAFIDDALAWAAEGRFRHEEHIAHGIDAAPQAFVDMLAGAHLGKAMVEL